MKNYKAIVVEGNTKVGPFSFYDFSDYLPKHGRPGKWLPKIERLSICESGWHYCRGIRQMKKYISEGFVFMINNYAVYEVEISGEALSDKEKSCTQQIRLVKKVWQA
jgi:hypothetical protein